MLRKLPASSIQVVFSAPGPRVRERLITVPAITKAAPARNVRPPMGPLAVCRNSAGRSQSRAIARDRTKDLPAGVVARR